MGYTKEYYAEHKEEILAKNRAYRVTHRAQLKAKSKEKRDRFPDINKERCRNYREMHIEERRKAERLYSETHRAQKQEYDKQYRSDNDDKIVDYQARRRDRLWKSALAFFGPCACCGESRIPFLTIDHKNGGGNQLRIKGEKYGWGLLSAWNTQGWPEDLKKTYRILCHNCNQATRYGRTCPHEIANAESQAERLSIK